MGNSASHHGDGVPFVSWKRLPAVDGDANDANDAANDTASDSGSAPPSAPRSGSNHSVTGLSALAATVVGVTTWHFAEPSCYSYDKWPRVVTAALAFADPPKADGELRNQSELLGSIVVVERGGRVHFPDIVRRLLAAGAAGCVFIERNANAPPATQSLFDGFHSSGRQSVAMPIVLLAKSHADQLVRDRPTRVTIELLSGDDAIKRVVEEDQVVAVSTAARAGEVELLKHILYSDTTGSIREASGSGTFS